MRDAGIDYGFVDTNLIWFFRMARAISEAKAGLVMVDEMRLLDFLRMQDWPLGDIVSESNASAIQVIRRRLLTGEE